MHCALHILIIEDDKEGMAEEIYRRLHLIREKFPEARISIVGTKSEGMIIVGSIPRPDCVFLDLGLPDSTWMQTIESVDEIESQSPVIIITGHPEKMVMDLLKNKEIQVIHKDETMWGKLLGAILRAISRGKSDPLGENIRRMKEILSQYATAEN